MTTPSLPPATPRSLWAVWARPLQGAASGSRPLQEGAPPQDPFISSSTPTLPPSALAPLPQSVISSSAPSAPSAPQPERQDSGINPQWALSFGDPLGPGIAASGEGEKAEAIEIVAAVPFESIAQKHAQLEGVIGFDVASVWPQWLPRFEFVRIFLVKSEQSQALQWRRSGELEEGEEVVLEGLARDFELLHKQGQQMLERLAATPAAG